MSVRLHHRHRRAGRRRQRHAGARLADYYHLNHLDTGLTYRAVAQALLSHGLPLDDASAAETAARQVDLAKLDRTVLSAHAVGEAASKVAVIPAVRRALVDKQRALCQSSRRAPCSTGATSAPWSAPMPTVKLYVTASAEVRARRRLGEIEAQWRQADFAEILADIERRDERDMGRADSPLKPAADAHLLDTSEMDIEAAFLAAKAIIDDAMAARDTARASRLIAAARLAELTRNAHMPSQNPACQHSFCAGPAAMN